MSKMPVAQLVNMFDGEVHLIKGEKCVIGRQSDEDGITVSESIISREHAIIYFEGNQYRLQDNGSKNGTFLNGERLEKGMSRKLRHGDTVEFSKLKYIFRILTEEENHLTIKGLEGGIEIAGGQKRLVVALPKEKFVKYQQKMQESNKIKGIMEASSLDAGDRVLLYYEIDGLKRLESLILKQELQEKEILEILLQITEIVRGLARYLLPEDNLVLEPGMIFITDEGVVKLIHLPMERQDDAPGVEKTLLGVALFALPKYTRQLCGSDEDLHSPMQLRRFLTECVETLKKEAVVPTIEEPDPKRGAHGMTDFLGKWRTKEKFNLSKPVGILLMQIPVLLLILGVYACQILKPIDFLGFFVITAALDAWMVKTLRKPEEDSA